MKIFKSRIDVNVSSAFLLLSESVICFSIFPFFCLLYQILPLQVLKDAAKLQFLWHSLIPFDAFLSLSIPFDAFLCFSILFDAFLCFSIPFDAFLCFSILFDAFLCFSIPFDAFLCFSILFDAFLCFSIPFDAFLCFSILFDAFLSLLMLFSFVFVFPNKSFRTCNQVI